jgi:hypothetical protein
MCQPSAVSASEPVHQPTPSSMAMVARVSSVTHASARSRRLWPSSV